MRKKKLVLGDIYEIPLPDGKYAYGRLFKDCIIGIFKNRYASYAELSPDTAYEFYVGVYKDLLQDNEWKIVDNIKFDTEDDAWAPPQCVIDAITKEGALYYKGEIKPCTYEDCKDLEIAAVWEKHHLVDRLMGNDIWEKSMGRPVNPNK